MKDKNIDEMLNSVKSSFDKIYFYEINYDRSASIKLLTEQANKLKMDFGIVENLNVFLKDQLNGDKDSCLAVAGSMYLLGEIKSILAEIKS